MKKTHGNKFRLLVNSIKKENSSKSVEKDNTLSSMENGLVAGDLDMEGGSTGLGSVDSKGRGPLHLAAMTGQLKKIEFLISNGADPNLRDSLGNTPLHLAVEANQTGSISVLLSCGADPSVLNDRSLGAIHCAIRDNNIDALKELLKSGRVDPNQDGEDGCTPLHYCAWFDRSDCAKIMLENKANLRRQSDVGLYPLQVAAQNGSKATLQVFVEYSEKRGLPVQEFLERISQDRTTPLQAAIAGGDVKSVKTFMLYGAPIDDSQEDGSTAVHQAAAQGSTEIIQLMFEMQPEKKVTCLTSRDSMGMTPLHRAALMDRSRTVEFLLRSGSEVNERTEDGQTALLVAASRRAWATARTLVNANADVTLKDSENRNVVQLIIRGGGQLEKLEICLCKESMRQLLDEQDNTGCTALHYACTQGQLKTVAKLLLLGSNPCTKTNLKQSSLHFAARNGHYETCRLLIEYTPCGSNLVNETDCQGQTPLHSSAEEGHVKVVKLLLKRGASAVKDCNFNTPLHLAAKRGFVDTLVAILDIHGVVLNTLNKNHDSCLHLASEEGHFKVVELLLTKGCRMNLNKDDLYPLDLATKNGHQEACKAFISHERWRDVMACKSSLYGCPMVGLIRHMPEVCKIILDRSCIPSGSDPKTPDFHYVYDFKYLQIKHELLCVLNKNGYNALPLFAMNMMVRFNRIECLCHPVCRKFLDMKWEAYGRWCHLANLLFYLIFLFSLSGFILTQQYCRVLERKFSSDYRHFNDSVGEEDLCGGYHRPNTKAWFVVEVLLIISSCLGIAKILIQMAQQGFAYFTEATNLLECILYLSSGIFAGSFVFQLEFEFRWTCGTVAIFLAWFNMLLFLQRFEYFGIHIVMFLEILKTLVKVITVFFVLIIAFGIVFMILQTEGNSVSFASPILSLMSTGLMMLGAIDYTETWATPFNRGELKHPVLNFLMLVVFILFMPILLINLLIGLAVGDIDSVRKNACLKRLAMQVQLYTELEERLPMRLIKFVDKSVVKVYPNSPSCTLWQRVKERFLKKEFLTEGTGADGGESEEGHQPDDDTHVCKELEKQKLRLDQISGALDKQHCILRLILQKMGIDEEVDECEDDEPPSIGASSPGDVTTPLKDEDQRSSGGGWSSNVLRHMMLKQAGVIAKWKQKDDN